MDYLGKGEVLTNTDLDRCVNNIWEKQAFCVDRKSLQLMENLGNNKCCVYNFIQCNILVHFCPSIESPCNQNFSRFKKIL